MEGSGNSKWILMDDFNTVVHVFHPKTRGFDGNSNNFGVMPR